MDSRLNYLYASESDRRIAEARRTATGARRRLLRPRWPSGRTVDPAMIGRRWGITWWY